MPKRSFFFHTYIFFPKKKEIKNHGCVNNLGNFTLDFTFVVICCRLVNRTICKAKAKKIEELHHNKKFLRKSEAKL